MSDPVDNLAFSLSDIYAGYHKPVLHIENPESFRVAEWRRTARFVLDFIGDKKPQRPVPINDRTVGQMAGWLARVYVGREELPDGYWRRTEVPWRSVAQTVLEMGVR